MKNALDLARSAGLTQRLVAYINKGEPGFLAVRREENQLVLLTQRRELPIISLHMSLSNGQTTYKATEKDFQGLLLVGKNRDVDNVDIISFVGDTQETVQFSSKNEILTGSLVVVAAVNENQEPLAWAESVVFSQGQGSLYFGSDKNFIQYALIVSRLVEEPEYEVIGEILQ